MGDQEWLQNTQAYHGMGTCLQILYTHAPNSEFNKFRKKKKKKKKKTRWSLNESKLKFDNFKLKCILWPSSSWRSEPSEKLKYGKRMIFCIKRDKGKGWSSRRVVEAHGEKFIATRPISDEATGQVLNFPILSIACYMYSNRLMFLCKISIWDVSPKQSLH